MDQQIITNIVILNFLDPTINVHSCRSELTPLLTILPNDYL